MPEAPDAPDGGGRGGGGGGDGGDPGGSPAVLHMLLAAVVSMSFVIVLLRFLQHAVRANCPFISDGIEVVVEDYVVVVVVGAKGAVCGCVWLVEAKYIGESGLVTRSITGVGHKEDDRVVLLNR
ncbi:hypothetical protein Tco_1144103 [Tanacetum coccineum]